MSDFSKLLKTSRFASLAKPLAKKRNARYPTHQIVETRDAALSRQEWGLKYALPQKLKSRYITFNDVDSLERIVDFEAGGGNHYKRLRFQELGLVPTRAAEYEREFVSNPLFQESEESALKSVDAVMAVLATDKKLKVDSSLQELSSLRPQFKEYLLANHAKDLKERGLDIGFFTKTAVKFLKDYKSTQNVNNLASLKRQDGFKFAGTGGLSYALKGRLRTTPNGVINSEFAPARMLANQQLALGGFVASDGKMSAPNLERTEVFAVNPIRAKINPFGTVSIDAIKSRHSMDLASKRKNAFIKSKSASFRRSAVKSDNESWKLLSGIIGEK